MASAMSSEIRHSEVRLKFFLVYYELKQDTDTKFLGKAS